MFIRIGCLVIGVMSPNFGSGTVSVPFPRRLTSLQIKGKLPLSHRSHRSHWARYVWVWMGVRVVPHDGGYLYIGDFGDFDLVCPLFERICTVTRPVPYGDFGDVASTAPDFLDEILTLA